MKKMYLCLEVPDDLDPEEILETMSADFWEMNRGNYEEWFPDRDIMSHINLRILEKAPDGYIA